MSSGLPFVAMKQLVIALVLVALPALAQEQRFVLSALKC